MYNISFHYYQNLVSDCKKISAPRENSHIPTQPISWIAEWTIPRIKQNTARDPNFFWVARSGPGIPDGPGHPAHLKHQCLLYHHICKNSLFPTLLLVNSVLQTNFFCPTNNFILWRSQFLVPLSFDLCPW